MERFLCLDIGDKRIGVAVSDPFGTYALPVKTVVRKNLSADISEIERLVKEKYATAIVCGLPLNFDGSESIQTEKARFFIEKLKSKTGLPVFSVDERCTTVEAEEKLINNGVKREERKNCVDALAAAEILNGYLNDMNSKKTALKENDMSEEKKHLHDETCDCGCEHDHEEHCDCGCDDDIVVLTTDDGKKLKFYFVGTIEYKGKNYSAFEPAEKIDGIEEDDLIIFELSGDDEETADLLPIEDEKLLDEVFEEFCKALDEADEEDGEFEEDDK